MFADTPTQDNALATAASELALALDLDFLPERYRPRRLTLRSLRPALFVLGFALLLIPLGRYWGEARLQLAAVEASLTQVQANLQGYQPLAEERAGLEARIASAQAASAEALAGLGDFSEVVLRSVTRLEPLPDPELPAEAEAPAVVYYFEISAF